MGTGTQVTDADVVEAAFNLGARGYLVKQQAETELLAALAAVLGGDRVVSSGLGEYGFTLTKDQGD